MRDRGLQRAVGGGDSCHSPPARLGLKPGHSFSTCTAGFGPRPSSSESPRFLTYGSNQHEGLAELLPLPHPSGYSGEAEGCVGLSVPVVPARTASPGGVMDPKSWAGSSMGTAPLAALVWLTPELMEPIHGVGTLLPHPGTSLRHGPPKMFFSHHIKDIKL